MVVKILSSAASFSGVGYNLKKLNTGSAEIVAVENFGLLEGSGQSSRIEDYVHYLQAWSTNERGMIDKPQFHAVISCQGQEKDAQELKAIAEEYLNAMGYKNNPYLVVFHADTNNNHVHIVSSRVGEDGKKINDSFERRRSQAAIKEIMQQDIGYEIKSSVEGALKFNFSSEAQFKLLLEMQGITVKEKAGAYQFIKYGSVGYELSKELVNAKIQSYSEPEERVKQLRSIFKKYKPALTAEQFQDFMKTKFGVTLVFHTAKGKHAPYGYSIIDNAKGQVFKGSQIMKLSALLHTVPRADMLTSASELITTLANDEKLRYRDLKSKLSKLGFELHTSGQVRISGEEQPSFSISKERMKQVLYNDRLFEAQKFVINSQAEADILGRVMFLKKEDAASLGQSQQNQQARQLAQQILSDKLNSLLATRIDFGDIAKENKYVFAKKGGDIFLIDKKGYAIYNIEQLTDHKLDYRGVDIVDMDKVYKNSSNTFDRDSTKGMEQASGSFDDVFSALLYVLQSSNGGAEGENREKRKRRRKR